MVLTLEYAHEFILSNLPQYIIVHGCVCLIYSDGTLDKGTPSVSNSLDANHKLGKTESSQQPELFYMTSDIGNKNSPQKVRYYDSSDSKSVYIYNY